MSDSRISERDPTADGTAGERLETLRPGMPIVYGGNRVTRVGPELAAAFAPGDRLLVVPDDGALLHVPAADQAAATEAVDDASQAFAVLAGCPDEQITRFYRSFADRLADD